MADLRVKIGRLELKNPIIVASSPLTAKLDLIKRAEENGATCVSIKHTMLKQQFIAKPRWFVNRNIGMMVSGDPRLPAEEAQELIRKVKEQTGVTVLVNMSASPEDITTWSTLAGKLAEAGADGVELNFNCPNLHTASHQGKGAGANMGTDPDSCSQVVAEIRSKVDIPIIAKLVSEGGKMLQVAKACEDAGVDAVNVHAGGRGAPGLDIYNKGAFMYPGSPTGNFGGHSGQWSKYLSNRFIADTAAVVKCSIVGGGGVFTWQDLVENLMYGSQAVQICTSIMYHGFELVRQMLEQLEAFMDDQGYETVADFAGIALKNVRPPNQMQYADISAVINPEKCSGCGSCDKLPTCPAIERDNDTRKYKVNREKCLACGLCYGICPKKAIEFEAN